MSPPPESQYKLLRRIPSMQAPKFTINLRLPHPAATAGAAVRATATLVGRRHKLNSTHSHILGDLNGLLGSRSNRLIQGAPAIRAITRLDRNTTQGNSNTNKNTHYQSSFLFNARTEHDTTCRSAPGRRHHPSGSCPNPECRCCSWGSCRSRLPRNDQCNPRHGQ